MNKTKELINEIIKKNNHLKKSCDAILAKHEKPELMAPRDYIYFVFSTNIVYKVKDILHLNKKLIQEKNIFDTSLYILNRSILEDFFYFSYLLSDPTKVDYKLKAFTCHNNKSNLNLTEALIRLNGKNKFIFNEDPEDVLSIEKMSSRRKEWSAYIEKVEKEQEDLSIFKNEIEQFKNIEQICQKYDKSKGISKVEEGRETESLEWMYNFIFKFQSMAAHQNLAHKESVFALYLNKRSTPNNEQILSLVLHILERTLAMQ